MKINFSMLSKIPELLLKAVVLRERFINLREKYKNDSEFLDLHNELDEFFAEASQIVKK